MRTSGDSGAISQPSRRDFEPSVDLTAVVGAAVRGWYWLAIGSLLVAIVFGVYSSRSPRVYRSEALVSVVQDAASSSGGGSSGAGRLSTVASMVGLNIGGAQDRRAEYIALLTSRRLIAELIKQENLLPILYASRWDAATGTWKASLSKNEIPTMNAAIEYFSRKILFVVEDRKTGLIRVSVEWFDPELAAAWVNSVVSLVNFDVRQTTIAEAKNTLEFLNKELQQTLQIQVRDGIYRLVEGSLSRIALANVQQQYAFKILDPARAPDPGQTVRPRPLLAAIAGATFGGMASLLLLLWRSRRVWLALPEDSSRND